MPYHCLIMWYCVVVEVKFINPMELDSAAKKVCISWYWLVHLVGCYPYCVHYSLGWRRLLFSLQKSSIFATFLTVLPRKKWWCWVCHLAVWPTSCCYDQKTKHSLKWLMPQMLLLCLRIIQPYLLQLGTHMTQLLWLKAHSHVYKADMCVVYIL